MFIISFFKFILFILLFSYLPAKVIFHKLHIKSDDIFIDRGLSITFGITLFTLCTLFLKPLRISLSFLWIIPIFSIIYLLFFITDFKKELVLFSKKKHILAYLVIISVILIGVISQNLVLFRGGMQVSGGLVFPSSHDTMWNIALSTELYHHFPPHNPAISTQPLKNNHYFYPMFLATVRYLTGNNIFDLYFRFMPVLVSLLFGLGLYAVSAIFTKNMSFRALAIFLGYFSGNFAYFIPFFTKANFDWKGNTFFADQPFDQIINPYSVFGFALMLYGVYCLSESMQAKKNFSWGYSIVGGLLFGILYGFKSFGGLIVILALIATIFLQFIFYRNLILLPITVTSLILFGLIFFLTTDPGSASLIWAPGWLLTQMMTDKDKLNLPHFADLEAFYRLNSNKIGLLKIKTIELAIYMIGNLGTRIVGLVYLLYILFITHVRGRKYIMQFIGIIIFTSLTIPLFFNLQNSTFNIIQFTPYSSVLLALISAYFLEIIYKYFSIRGKKIVGVTVILLFIILSIPVNVKNIIDKLEMPKDIISNEEISALNFLRENTKFTDTILIDPNQFSQDAIYIPALSERRIFLASPGYAIQTGLDPEKQSQEVNEFFKIGDRKFLDKNKISYIYLLKPNIDVEKILLLQKISAETVFENDRVIIRKI